MVQEGSPAPPLDVIDDSGKTVRLADYAGRKNVVLFFFPKADTPG